jgi:hypothetical protein
LKKSKSLHLEKPKMSAEAQTIWYLIAFIGCFVAAFWSYVTPANRVGFGWFHPGWLGLAAFIFVPLWISMQAM